MKRILSLAAAVCAVSFAAAAQAGPMDGAFGNTVVLDYGNNMVAKMHANADGSYSVLQPDGKTSKGTWTATGGQTCFSQTDPAPPAGAAPSCSASVDGKVAGDSWTGAGAGGAAVKISIVAGR